MRESDELFEIIKPIAKEMQAIIRESEEKRLSDRKTTSVIRDSNSFHTSADITENLDEIIRKTISNNSKDNKKHAKEFEKLIFDKEGLLKEAENLRLQCVEIEYELKNGKWLVKEQDAIEKFLSHMWSAYIDRYKII